MRWWSPLLGMLLAVPPISAQVANWPLNDPAFTAPAEALGPLAVQPGSAAALPVPAEAASISSAKLRDAIRRQQTLIVAHPQSVSARTGMVYLLVDAGAGEQARAVAQKAVAMAPDSAQALAAQGWACEHDLIGVRLGGGFRWKESIAAWRKAVADAPASSGARLQLAVLDEYDTNGFRYSSGARLDDAITQYRRLRTINRGVASRYEDNLLFDLLYARRYAELLSETKRVAVTPARLPLVIAAEAASKNAAAGIEAARPLSGAARVAAIRTAAAALVSLRLYAQAADLLAGCGSAPPPGQVDMLRNLPQHAAYAESLRRSVMPLLNAPELPHGITGTEPRAVVQDLVVAELTGRLDDEALVSMLIAHHSYPTAESQHRLVRRDIDAADSLLRMWKKTGCAFDVLSDLALSRVRFSVSGEDQAGFRVTLEPVNGSAAQTFFVIHRQGYYHVVGNTRTDQEAGSEALWMLQHNGEPTVRAILDWKREQPRGGNSSALATFWSIGEPAGPDTQRRETLATAALLVNSPALTPMLPTLAALRDKSPAAEQPAIDVLLARGYIYAGDRSNALAITRRLMAAHPDSATILSLAAQADAIGDDIGHWNQLLEAQLVKRPGDRSLLEQAAKKDESAGDFLRARADLKTILDGGHAATVDYNLYAWLALFTSPIAGDAMSSSLHANEMSDRSNFSALHTLGCLNAVTGHPGEARQVILHAMDVNNLAAPNDAVWMVMGYIYEQYGLKEAAIFAYHNVVKPERPVDPAESYVLAQRRLRVLGAGE